jgi:hypothetical protein
VLTLNTALTFHGYSEVVWLNQTGSEKTTATAPAGGFIFALRDPTFCRLCEGTNYPQIPPTKQIRSDGPLSEPGPERCGVGAANRLRKRPRRKAAEALYMRECGARLREVIALAEGVRRIAREGSLRVIVSNSFLKRAAEGKACAFANMPLLTEAASSVR